MVGENSTGAKLILLTDLETWDAKIAHLPGVHLLQSRSWANFKSLYGWKPFPLVWVDDQDHVNAAAMVLMRILAPGIQMLYVPRGPMLNWSDVTLRTKVIADLQAFARQQGAIFIKMDPEIIVGIGKPGDPNSYADEVGLGVEDQLIRLRWLRSAEQIQFRNTVWIDLRGDENDWLDRMKQKTRYNLRLAERKGVVVRHGDAKDFPLLYRMYAETSIRDGFVIRAEDYYARVWQNFTEQGAAIPLIAEVDGEPVAALFLFWYAGRAWYLYGMSSEMHREKMPNYLLQWQAMRLAKLKGCEVYDLWGAPDVFDETDSMWGVYKFKEGLGGKVIRTPGAWDFVTRPLLFSLYTRILPKVLNVMRRRGKTKTKQEVGV